MRPLSNGCVFVMHSLVSHKNEYTEEIEKILAALIYKTVKIMLENSVSELFICQAVRLRDLLVT
jgi:hypothetical protein